MGYLTCSRDVLFLLGGNNSYLKYYQTPVRLWKINYNFYLHFKNIWTTAEIMSHSCIIFSILFTSNLPSSLSPYLDLILRFKTSCFVSSLNTLHYSFTSSDNKASKKDGHKKCTVKDIESWVLCNFNGPHCFDICVAGIRKKYEKFHKG
jgi:hypothetical protein